MENHSITVTPELVDLYSAILAIFPGNEVVRFIAEDASRGQERLAELSALAKAKKRVAGAASQNALTLGHPPSLLPDLALLGSESGGLLASIDARQSAISRSIRQDVRLAIDVRKSLGRAVAGPSTELPKLPRQLASEKSCASYLCDWQDLRGTRCRKCGYGEFYRISNRHVRECVDCGAHTSIRQDTIMEGSHLPLRCWFAAVQAVLVAPQVSAADLVSHLELKRIGTARKVKRAVLRAVDSPDASLVLAGLDAVFGRKPVTSALSPAATLSPPNMDLGSG